MADYEIPSDKFAKPKSIKASLGASVAEPFAFHNDHERQVALDNILRDLFDQRDYSEIARVASLANRLQQVIHVLYQIDDLINNGPRRKRGL